MRSIAWFSTRLIMEFPMVSEKKLHTAIPASANSTYGTPSLGTFTNRPRTTERTDAVRIGRSTAQPTPTAACL